MNNAAAVELVNVTKTFGSVVANKNVNMDVKKGEILAILGENGSGKTTLATEIAAAVNCENSSNRSAPLPCGRCASCRRIYEGNFPDLKFLKKKREKATLGVEEVKDFREDMFLSSTEAEKSPFASVAPILLLQFVASLPLKSQLLDIPPECALVGNGQPIRCSPLPKLDNAERTKSLSCHT